MRSFFQKLLASIFPRPVPPILAPPVIAPTPPGTDGRFSGETLALINDIRGYPLRWSDALANAALLHCREMARRGDADHDFPGYPSLLERARAAGWGWGGVGECVGQYQITPEQIVRAWRGSPGHAREMLSARYRYAGVAVVYSPNGPFWTLILGE